VFTFKVYHQIDQLENQWNSLLEATDTTNIFLNFYWARNWLKNYHNHVESLQVIVIFDNNKCIAIAPLYISSYHKETLALLGTNEPEWCEVQAEAMDIIYLAEYHDALVNYFVKIFETHFPIPSITLKNISKTSFIHNIATKLTSKYFYIQNSSCYQFIFNQFDSVNSTLLLNKNNKNNKRILNKFLKNDICTYEVADTDKEKKELFDTLVELHQKHWNYKGKKGVFAEREFLNFHRALLFDVNFNKNILLTAVKHDKKVLSVNYSFITKNKVYFYQAGIDSLFKPNFSPGLLNHLLLIKHGESIGVEEYNLLLSEDINSYKAKLSNRTTTLITVELHKYTFKNVFKLLLLKLNVINKLSGIIKNTVRN
jgi:CelD/BcsL family acetyltransferase involved in cellulose biosynthesis